MTGSFFFFHESHASKGRHMTPVLHVGIPHWLTLGAPLGALSLENIDVLNSKDKFEPFTTHIL